MRLFKLYASTFPYVYVSVCVNGNEMIVNLLNGTNVIWDKQGKKKKLWRKCSERSKPDRPLSCLVKYRNAVEVLVCFEE